MKVGVEETYPPLMWQSPGPATEDSSMPCGSLHVLIENLLL